MGTFIRKGTTFVDGTTIVNSTNLNAHVDDAIIEPTAISALTNKSPLAGTEEMMINDGGTLKKTALSSVNEYVSAVPVGTVVSFAGIVPPTGWFLCYGQAISRTTYSELFDSIGATYGSGDGATTFNLPDCRGRAIIGKDNMGGTSANRITSGGPETARIDGDALGAAGGTENPQYHIHMYNFTSFAGGGIFPGGSGITWTITSTNTNHPTHYPDIGTNAGTGESGNVQPSIVMHKIIKY